jgi:RES domain-containing protein
MAEVPAGSGGERARVESRPPAWREHPAPEALAEIGDRWIAKRRTAGLRVRSAVVPSESNDLLNPGHPDFRAIRIAARERFTLDPRLRGPR